VISTQFFKQKVRMSLSFMKGEPASGKVGTFDVSEDDVSDSESDYFQAKTPQKVKTTKYSPEKNKSPHQLSRTPHKK